ncbi:MAG: hypothetical protein FWG87_03055 [Defluviitaleaceae bacterium]|nr:hypothetical protein [Defluviitaleaceae bacterium]
MPLFSEWSVVGISPRSLNSFPAYSRPITKIFSQLGIIILEEFRNKLSQISPLTNHNPI